MREQHITIIDIEANRDVVFHIPRFRKMTEESDRLYVIVIIHNGEQRKSNDPVFVTICLRFILSVSEILADVLGYEISCNKKKPVTCSHVKQATHNSPLRQNPSPSIPRFHAIPLQALFLAMLYARPKQFSNKLFAFVGIHFQLFLHSPFVVGSDCLSEFPHSHRE